MIILKFIWKGETRQIMVVLVGAIVVVHGSTSISSSSKCSSGISSNSISRGLVAWNYQTIGP